MKISKDTFGELSNAIDVVVLKQGLEKIKEHRQNVNYVKSQFIAFCWSMFHESKFGETHREIYDTLNDSHIETALKRILSDFE